LLNDSHRIEAIRRYREQSLDRAAVIAALALARVDEYELGALADRQDAQLAELVHDFAFRLRKLIELAKREMLSSCELAYRETVPCSPEGGDTHDFKLTMMSLADVCGRVIHSDLFAVRRSQIPTVQGELTDGRAAWGFQVASDRDKGGRSHFIFIEFFLKDFLAFDELLANDLRRKSRPAI
jgi:hypothetical protein